MGKEGKALLMAIVAGVAGMMVYDWIKGQQIRPSKIPAAPAGTYDWLDSGAPHGYISDPFKPRTYTL